MDGWVCTVEVQPVATFNVWRDDQDIHGGVLVHQHVSIAVHGNVAAATMSSSLSGHR